MKSQTPSLSSNAKTLVRNRQRRALRRLLIEGLELRQMMYGVTIITHGFTPDVIDPPEYPAWPIAMGQAVLDRADGADTARTHGSLFITQPFSDPSARTPDTSSQSPQWQSIDTFLGSPTTPVWNNSNDAQEDIVLLFNWVDESDKFQNGWLDAAADSLLASLMHKNDNLNGELKGRSFFDIGLDTASQSLNMHFIGHSRGAVVNSLVTQRIAAAFPGVMIEQVTSLDPHPASRMSDVGYDATNEKESQLFTSSNVAFADNYYRQDDSYELDGDFDGVVASGATNLRLDENTLTQFSGGYVAEHSDVHAWYYGTITDALPTSYIGFNGASRNNNGDGAIIPNGWYGGLHPQRSLTGFSYSAIGGRLLTLGQPQGDKLAVASGSMDVLANGNFESVPGGGSSIPGWGAQGGGGQGRVIKENTTNSVLQLGPTSALTPAATQTHNRLYIPASSNILRYDYRAPVVPVPGSVLEVTLNGVVVDQLAFDVATAWSRNRSISIPTSLRGNTASLQFRVQDGSQFAAGTIVQIDNVTIEAGGVTGDVLPVQLGNLSRSSATFAIKSIRTLGIAEGVPSQAVRMTLNKRGDLELTDVNNKLLGTIVFPEREPGALPYTQTGKFAFVPSTLNGLVGDNAANQVGFQGALRIEFTVTEQFNGSPVDVLQTLDLHIHPGMSSRGTTSISAQAGLDQTLAVQQRLNYLRARDYADHPAFLQNPALAANPTTNPQIARVQVAVCRVLYAVFLQVG